MKKIFRLVTLFCGVVVLSHSAHAKCTLLSCDDTSLVDPNGWITADVGHNQCWFCGPGPNSCSDNEVVPYLDGVGDVIGLWQCSTGFTNEFTNYEPGYFCDNSELKSSEGIGGVDLTNAKKTYRIDGVATSSFSLGDLDAFIGRASCIYVKCNEGYVPSPDKTKCVEGSAADTTPEPAPKTTPAPTITCVDRCRGMTGQQYNECVACCHVPSAVANWNGNTCICAQNANYLFVPNSDPTTGGQCYMHEQLPEIVVTPDPGYECDPVKIAQIMGWQVQYASNATISGQILAIIQYCDGNPNEITFNTMYNQLLALINQESAAAQLSSQQDASRRRIANAASDIRSVVDNLDVSKWRTAEGDFNTSRLLSDSIAGVVLGTAGGLITSNVMKKNQASNGLEDIQCTVGGQVVAGWGDQFQVGIH